MTDEQKGLKEFIEEFRIAQAKYLEYGACDSEPDWISQDVMEKALRRKRFTVPKTADDWQLYTASMKCGRAARSLTARLNKVVMQILGMTQKDAAEVLEEYLWRVDL